MSYSKSVELYGDGIGKVEYVSHMGSDLTVVNSARVSFGVEKEQLDDKDKKLINYLTWSITLLHSVFVFLYIFVVSITAIELGLIMRYPGGILMWISDSMSQRLSGRSISQTDKHQTPKS